MMNRRFGFSLIEMIIAVAIITVLSTVGVLAYSGRVEKNALIEMQSEIPTFFKTVCEKSYESGERYKVNCDFLEKEMQILDIETENTLENCKLAEELNYVFINSKKELTSEVSRNTTNTGNISKGFTIYIFNNDGKALHKISFSNTTEYVKFVKINETEPVKDMYLNDFSYGRELTEDEEDIVNYKNWQ